MLDSRDPFAAVEGGGMDAAGAAAVLRSVAVLVREIRLTRWFSQTEVAERCEVTGQTLCRVELGQREPKLGLLVMLCGLLGVRPSAVLRLAEDEAFPIEPLPWSSEPADLLGLSRPHGAVILERGPLVRRRGGGAHGEL